MHDAHDHDGRQPLLQVIIGSTRPGRVGEPVARWFVERAEEHGAFSVEVTDLAELDLPFLDEPNHPRLRRYQHEHTRRWSETVERSDAFVVVTPEYNYGMSAALKHALDYLLHEWPSKPVGSVSYGGVSAGTRAVQMIRQVVASLRMVSVTDAVNIPFVARMMEDGELRANDTMTEAADTMLDELARLAVALRPLRAPAAVAV